MKRVGLLFAVAGLALLSCGQGNSGPPIAHAKIPIDDADVPIIISKSRIFAKMNDLSFESTNGPHGFTVYMTKADFSMAAINGIESDVAYLTAWDKGKYEREHIKLARQYIAEIEKAAARRPLKASL